MSGNICSYRDCMTRRMSFSSIAFFGIPNDSRRSTWIRNSGNKELEGLTANQARFLCEKHFQPCDINEQFNRKTLRRHAVPQPYSSGHAGQQVDDEIMEIGSAEVKTDVPMLQASKGEQNAVPDTYIGSERNGDDENSVLYVEYENYNDLENSEFVAPHADNVDEPLYRLDLVPEEPAVSLAQDEPSFNSETSEFAQPSAAAAAVEPKTCAMEQSPMPTASADEDYASDRHFALSLVNYFQRLGAEKKAMAKVKILTYLTELEFGKSEVSI